jgi:hypothetical protein
MVLHNAAVTGSLTINGTDVFEDIAVSQNMGNKELKDLFK